MDHLSADRSDAIFSEMVRGLYPYVLLMFLPCSESAYKSVCLAVVFQLGGAPLIMIRHDWQIGFDAKDQRYLTELMDVWTKTPPEEVIALFLQLECLSVGPIKATVSGMATSETVERLTSDLLGRAAVSGQWTM